MALVVSASPLQMNARQDSNGTMPADNSTVPAENSTVHAPGSAASDWIAQGCFTDQPEPDRVLKQANFTSVVMTYDTCVAACQSQNATVAGVKNGERCRFSSEGTPFTHVH